MNNHLSKVQTRLRQLRFNSCSISIAEVFSMAAEDPLAVAVDLTIRRQSAVAMNQRFPVRYLESVWSQLQASDFSSYEGREDELRCVINHAVFSGLRRTGWPVNLDPLKNGPQAV